MNAYRSNSVPSPDLTRAESNRRSTFRATVVLGLMLLVATHHSMAFKPEGHEQVTIDVLHNELGYEQPSAAQVGRANAQTDYWEYFSDAAHGDSNRLDLASERLRKKLETISRAMYSCEMGRARDQLGQALHTVQDLYSHSNSIDNHHPFFSLLDLQQGTASCDAQNGFAPLGLVSGYFAPKSAVSRKLPSIFHDYFNECWDMPDGMCCHWDLNKDAPEEANGARHVEALTAARVGTHDYPGMIESALRQKFPAVNSAQVPIMFRALKQKRRSVFFLLDATVNMGDGVGEASAGINRFLDRVNFDTAQDIPEIGMAEFWDIYFPDNVYCGHEIAGPSDSSFGGRQQLRRRLGLFDGPAGYGFGSAYGELINYSLLNILTAGDSPEYGNDAFLHPDQRNSWKDTHILVISNSISSNLQWGPLIALKAKLAGAVIDTIYADELDAQLAGIHSAAKSASLTKSNDPARDPLIQPLSAQEYLQALAEATGGTAISLNHGEISDGLLSALDMTDTEKQLLLERRWPAGTAVAAIVEVPVDDELTESLTFILKSDLPGALPGMAVKRADGGLVLESDAGVTHHRGDTFEQFTISAPANGNWKVEVTGGSGARLYVRGKSSIALSEPSYQRERGAARLPRGETPLLEGTPIAGTEIVVASVLSELVTNPRVHLRRLNGELIQEVVPTLNADLQLSAAAQVPNEEFFIELRGQSTAGMQFVRQFPQAIKPVTVGIRSDLPVLPVTPGESTSFPLRILNHDVLPGSFSVRVRATSTESADLVYGPLVVPANGELVFDLPLSVPQSAQVGDKLTLNLSVADSARYFNRNQASLTAVVIDQPPNYTPAAASESFTTPENTARQITVHGIDLLGETVTYLLLTQPQHGQLSGVIPNLVYAPAPGFHGNDGFRFRVSDGVQNSNDGVISITVTSVNQAPVASSISGEVPRNDSIGIELAASDADGDAITYVVTSQPQHGTLTGTPPHLVYRPQLNFVGVDQFFYQARDAESSSPNTPVTLTVVTTNHAPVANPINVQIAQGGTISLLLSGSDADGDALSFVIATQPQHGTLTGTAPNLVYHANANFLGTDQFAYQARDAESSSANAAISVAITAGNHAPIANPINATMVQARQLALALSGTDPDGDAIGFFITAPPQNGVLIGQAPNLTYRPNGTFVGTEMIQYQARDGSLSSPDTAITINVTAAPNGTPVAHPQTVLVTEDQAVSFVMAGSDPNGDTLTFSTLTQPAHGTLTGTAPNRVYTPAPDFSGTDSFNFWVRDRTTNSPTATITFIVAPLNDAPVAQPELFATVRDIPIDIVLRAFDADADPLQFELVSSPTHGQLSGALPNVRYSPAAGFIGTDQLSFRVRDQSLTSNTATIQIIVGAPVPRGALIAQFSVEPPPQSLTTFDNNIAALSAGATLTGYSSIHQSIIDSVGSGGLQPDGGSPRWESSEGGVREQFMVLQLGGERVRSFDRVRIINHTGSNATKRFSIAVSTTTDSPGAFATIYTSGLQKSDRVQEFILPYTAQARWVRYTAHDNYGGTSVGLDDLEIIDSTLGGIPSYAAGPELSVSSYFNAGMRPENLLDGGNYGGTDTVWRTAGSTPAGEYAVIRLHEEAPFDRILLQSPIGEDGLKAFEFFVRAQTGEWVRVLNAQMQRIREPQEFVFPGGAVRAREVKLVIGSVFGEPSTVEVSDLRIPVLTSSGHIISANNILPRVLRNNSPTLLINGGTVVRRSSAASIASTPEFMLNGTLDSDWTTIGVSDQYAVIALGPTEPTSISGVRLFPNGKTSGVKRFEIRTSNTDSADASFARVLEASLPQQGDEQTFLFPGGSVDAKFVKYIPLDNYGDAVRITTAELEVLSAKVRGVHSYSSRLDGAHRADMMLDQEQFTRWQSATGRVTNEWVKFSLDRDEPKKIYAIRIDPGSGVTPKDFELRVSTTTADDSAFSAVLSATLGNNGEVETFVLPNPAMARYAQLFFKNAYGTFAIGVDDVELITDERPEQAQLLSISSMQTIERSGQNLLSAESDTQSWESGLTKNTNQSVLFELPGGKSWLVDQVVFDSGPHYANATGVRQFELQVSDTNTADASFRTVVKAGLKVHSHWQHFRFEPTRARYVRVLARNAHLNFANVKTLGIHRIWVVSPERGPTTVRFRELSKNLESVGAQFAWDFGDGSGSAERDPLHTYPAPGVYDVSLRVTDAAGATSNSAIRYEATGERLIRFDVAPQSPNEGDLVHFTDTSGALDQTVTREWSFGDGSPASAGAAAVEHRYVDNGDYLVELRTMDLQGKAGLARKTVAIRNLAPVVELGANQSITTAIALTLTPTFDDAGLIDRQQLQCTLRFGDATAEVNGLCASLGTITHPYTLTGNYQVSLTVTDKDGASATDTLQVTVVAANTAPVAMSSAVQTDQNRAANILLQASDADADVLSYTIVTPTVHGSVVGTAPNLVYTPDHGFVGTDGLSFYVSDGSVQSNPATVTITVNRVNNVPVAQSQSFDAVLTANVSISVSANDADPDDILQYLLVDAPLHGSLSGTLPNVVYTPAVDFDGNDQFHFKVNDGHVDSNVASVSFSMPPRLSVADAEVLEGNSGNQSLLARLRLSSVASSDIEVHWRTAARTAVGGSDYVEASGVNTIASGSDGVGVPINVIGDVLLEADETFDFEIVSAAGMRIERGRALMTIRDDEQCPGPNLIANGGAELPMVNNEIPGWNEIKGNDWRAWAAPPRAAEGNFSFDVGSAAADGLAELRQEVNLSPYAAVIDAGKQQFVFSGSLRTLNENPSDLARVVVEYLNADGSAVLSQFDSGEISSPDSWRALSDQRVVPAGTRKARVRLLARKVSVAKLDAWFDNLNFRSLRTPTLSLVDATAGEASAAANVAVTLSCALNQNLTVGYATANGSAGAGVDYTAANSTVTLAAGASTINIVVPIINDSAFESSESFAVNLSTIPSIPGLVVLKSNATVTITDDDPAPPSCSAQPMGLANGYNVFVLETMTQANSDVEGKLAVGTNGNVSNYSVGFNLTGSGTDVLVVGGNLTFAGGTVHHGNLAYGGTATLTNFSIPNGSTRRATPINFTTEGNTLRNRSTHFAGLPVNGTTEVAASKAITLRASNANLNVFTVSGTDLARATQLSFAVPSASSVIVNVTGTGATMQFFGFQLNGLDRRKVLYNFAQATTLTLQGIGIEGSVLAPKAAVQFDNGQINGSLIGKSLNGSGQSNLSLFNGCLPIP